MRAIFKSSKTILKKVVCLNKKARYFIKTITVKKVENPTNP